MSDTPFPPFMPTQPSPPTQPEATQAAPKRKGRPPKVETTVLPATAMTADKPTRQKRKAALKAYSPKFDLQTTLAAAQTLNESDFPLFEKLTIMLDEAGKPARDRLLAAIGKVFG